MSSLRRRPFACICFGWLLLLSAASAHGQDPQTPPAPEVPWEGYQAFKFLLLANGLEPVSSLDELMPNRDASHSVLISLGGDGSEFGSAYNLRSFLRRGGMALIASDRASDGVLEKAFNLSITGEHWHARRAGSNLHFGWRAG